MKEVKNTPLFMCHNYMISPSNSLIELFIIEIQSTRSIKDILNLTLDAWMMLLL